MFLQRALEKYSVTVVLVLFQAAMVVCAFLGDYIMFGSFYVYEAASLIIMGVAFLVFLAALIIFCVRRSPASRDFEKSGGIEVVLGISLVSVHSASRHC